MVESLSLAAQRLQQELDTLRSERAEESKKHKAELKELMLETTDLRAQVSLTNAQVDKLNDELRAANDELHVAQGMLRAAQEEVRTVAKKAREDSEERLSILETEILQKDDIIEQLNTTIATINKELASKLFLVENSRKSNQPRESTDVDKERERRQALQGQCVYLGQEVSRLEKEVKYLRFMVQEQRNRLIEKNIYVGTPPSPTPSPTTNGNGSNSTSDPDITIKILSVENEDLRQKYFLSVGRSLKLQTSMSGAFSNISISELYDTVIERKINIEEWPNWISKQITSSLQMPT